VGSGVDGDVRRVDRILLLLSAIWQTGLSRVSYPAEDLYV